MLLASLFMIHDTSRGGKDKVTKLTSRQQVGGPLLKLTELDVEARGDDTALVEATIELDDNLSRTVVIDLLEFTNIAYLSCMNIPCLKRWSPNLPCFCIVDKNLTMTLEEGRMRTCLFPRLSALLMLFKQSCKTETLTIVIVLH
jgi:hypothetical protein